MEPRSLSRQLKARRREAGLSLAQAARRADTSAATLSRYENGWARFEIYTLRKLATALGCRLVVRIERVGRAPRKVRRKDALARLRRLFWDHELAEADLDEHTGWILVRVLEYGSLDDVGILIGLMGRGAFLEEVRRARFQTARTREFWRRMLQKEDLLPERDERSLGGDGIGMTLEKEGEEEGSSCTRESCRQEAWPSSTGSADGRGAD